MDKKRISIDIDPSTLSQMLASFFLGTILYCTIHEQMKDSEQMSPFIAIDNSYDQMLREFDKVLEFLGENHEKIIDKEALYQLSQLALQHIKAYDHNI